MSVTRTHLTRSYALFTGPASGGKPVPMDYDGDGTSDFSVHAGGAWHFYKDDGTYLKGIWVSAIAADIAVPGDYDGNGTEDVAIFRTGAWLFWDFATGASLPGVWTGAASNNGDPVRPTPSDYDGDGDLDFSTHAGGPWHFFNENGSYLKGIWTGAVVGDQAISRVQHYTGDVATGKWSFEEAGTVRGHVANDVAIHATHASERRRYFYSPELNLVAESELTSAANPGTAYEYIWFGGEPVGQYDALTSTPRWTFTDHLGTPLLLTNANASVHWRAEHEPYGRVFQMRTGDSHQPLRLPGQEAEQLNLGPNGITERSYNIFRWYRGGWGRYSQSDPIGLEGGLNLYRYALNNPIRVYDSAGLKAELLCREVSAAAGSGWLQRTIINLYQPLHCRLRVTCDCDTDSGSGFDKTVGRENVNPNGSPGIYDTTIDDYSSSAYPSPPWSSTPINTTGGSGCQFEKCALKAFGAQDKNLVWFLPTTGSGRTATTTLTS